MRRTNVIDSSLWVKKQAENKLVDGHFKSAIPLLEKLLRLGRNDISLQEFACARLGDSYISLRKFDKAENYLKKAVKLNSKESHYHYLLSIVYSASGMIASVIKELEHAVTLSPHESEYQRVLGWAKIICGESKEGIKHVRKAIKLNRENVYAYADLASYYLKLKQFSRVMRTLRRGLSEVPNNPFLLRAQILAERARKDYKKNKEQERKIRLRITKMNDPHFQKVRKTLLRSMTQSKYNEALKISAQKVWYDFYKLRKLKIKRHVVWAAALEYTIVRLNLVEGKTQKEISNRYGVSESVISYRFNDICRTLNIRVLDKRYATGEDSLFDIFDSLLLED
ncbi:MAG TPA: tetratricopeptide repeat protein [Thermodesulfobacteriota bacterium]|nr:tetratricopeptide repeat protein [Thermodesulfobacteriota bacterium]